VKQSVLLSSATLLLSLTANINTKYYAQTNQDKFVNIEFFKNKKNGFFVDIGAHDGTTFSNTYFFEKELEWTGLCFEPLSHRFEELQKNRPLSICYNAAIGAQQFHKKLRNFITVSSSSVAVEMLSGFQDTYEPKHLERLKRELKLFGGNYTINRMHTLCLPILLKEHRKTHIDLLSIDTEGSELEILKSIDFNALTIDVILVENNYQSPTIQTFLSSKGFISIPFKDSPGDEVYAHSSFLQKINYERISL